MRSAFVLSLLVVAALAAPSPKKPFGSLEFDSYWSLDEVYDYMAQLQADFPELCHVEIFGQSHEGRQIRGLRIANMEHLSVETLPIIFITGGVSARDWITVMAAVDIMHELIEHYSDFPHLVDDIEWFVVPVGNPDGYEFSRTPGNRAWIKNRQPHENSDCIGVNIDRNFAFNWGLEISSSSDPCSSNFRGTAADSEEETKSIQFANDIFSRIQRAYVTIKAGSPAAHSQVSFPFSSNNEIFMPNFQERIAVGNIITNGIWQSTGGRYRVSSEAQVNGLISGTSGDYAAGRDNIQLVYSIFAESGGNNGWDGPVSDINRIVDEIFAGVVALGNYVHGLPMPDAMEEETSA